VAITGEAYFEVAKDSHKPFRVMVNDVEVDVLGTHFNIDAYSDEAAVTATLLEGSVRVIRDPGQAKSGAAGQSIVLGPGQQARLEQGQLKMIAGSDMEQVMAWKNGLFQFRRTDLATVMRQLARWYDLDVVYEGKVPDVRFDGKIPRDAMASQVLGVLEKNQVHFRIEGKRLIVMP
jgi:ferric-dicitrate binding protein FerR (iron transport regulator)